MLKEEVKNDPHLKGIVLDSLERWGEEEDKEVFEEKFVDYTKYVRRKWIFMALCIVIIFVVTGYALTVGGYDIKFWETYQIIWDHITGDISDPNKDYVVINLRAPRIVLGILAGAALAASGCVMQSTLMNPLADPYTTGISSGALFGATLAIIMGISVVGGHAAVVVNAFVFSLIPMAVIVLVARLKQTSPTVMIMAGIAVMYIFNAFTTVIQLWADPNSLKEVYVWTVGSLANSGWEEIPIMLAVIIPGVIAIQLMARQLNLLAAGDDSAKSLGVDAEKMRTICMIVVSLIAATVVSFTGLIGFVGLVAPHIVRMFIGADNRYLLPASMFFGAALLILADLVGRTIIAPASLEVGVITSFIGGPLFLWIILRKDSKVWG